MPYTSTEARGKLPAYQHFPAPPQLQPITNTVRTLHLYGQDPVPLQPEPFTSTTGNLHSTSGNLNIYNRNPSPLQPDPFAPTAGALHPCTLNPSFSTAGTLHTLQPEPFRFLQAEDFYVYTRVEPETSLARPGPVTSTAGVRSYSRNPSHLQP